MPVTIEESIQGVLTMAAYLDITPDEYHKRPGLSSSIAKTLLDRSPLHAWQEHPCFGGKDAEPEEPTKAMDRGTVIHRLVLGKGKAFEVLDFKDWRTDKAKDARDAARAAGVVPILKGAFEDASKAAVEIMKALVARGIKLDGNSEQAMEWEETTESGLVLCRGMMDHVSADRLTIYDLKITHDASTTAIERSAENFGYAIQRAAYMSGNTKCNAPIVGRSWMRFIFAEPEPPFAVNIVEPDGMFREIGERRWRRAVETWGRCLKNNHWPAFGTGVNRISPPPWALSREGYSKDGF